MVLIFFLLFPLSSQGCDAETVGGVPIETVDVNLHTLSELLRLYLQDKAGGNMERVKDIC